MRWDGGGRARKPAMAGFGASGILVGIAAGVDMEYKCQPSSMRPAIRTSTLPPGGAAGGSTLSVEVTCWSCANSPQARKKSAKIAGLMRKVRSATILAVWCHLYMTYDPLQNSPQYLSRWCVYRYG